MQTKNSIDYSGAFFPSSESPSNLSSIRKQWLQHFCNNNHEKLKEKLNAYDSNFNISTFFYREGKSLLHWALITSPNIDSLNFIFDNVPKAVLKDVLSKDNFSLLKSFLIGESGIDEYQKPQEGWIDHRIQKLKLLLNLDYENVKALLEENMLEKWITEEVKNNIRSAFK